jgi:hypothetical protein
MHEKKKKKLTKDKNKKKEEDYIYKPERTYSRMEYKTTP